MTFKQGLIAIAASCALSAAAVAQPMEHGWHHGDMEGMEILHSLTLTDSQKAQIKQIMHAAWQQDKPVVEKLHALHEQMTTTLLTGGTVTADQLAPVQQQEETLRAQMDQQKLSTILQIRNLLTPEQLTQAAATHQKLESLHEQERAVMTNSSAPATAQ